MDLTLRWLIRSLGTFKVFRDAAFEYGLVEWDETQWNLCVWCYELCYQISTWWALLFYHNPANKVTRDLLYMGHYLWMGDPLCLKLCLTYRAVWYLKIFVNASSFENRLGFYGGNDGLANMEPLEEKFKMAEPIWRTVVPNTKKMVINIDLLNYWSNRKMVFPKIEKRDLIFKKNVSVVTLF